MLTLGKDELSLTISWFLSWLVHTQTAFLTLTILLDSVMLSSHHLNNDHVFLESNPVFFFFFVVECRVRHANRHTIMGWLTISVTNTDTPMQDLT